MQPRLTIAIPTRQRAEYLERCLELLHGASAWPFVFEVVVSDNASTDATADVVRRAIERGLPAVYLRQNEDVGAERNVASALRAARGTYCLYLGDDDRLDLPRVAEIVALLDRSPDVVCVQAPWRSQDDRTGENLGPYYPVERGVGFTRSTAFELWQFLVQGGVFPEIAVYRTAALLPVMHVPHGLHWAFVWCFRLLTQGTVAFVPKPFYVHVVRAADNLPPRRQLGIEQATTAMDRYRGGLEWALGAALELCPKDLVAARREQASLQLRAFLAERSLVAARIAAAQHNFTAALEHEARARLWTEPRDRAGLSEAEAKYCALATFQAVAEVARTTAGVARLLLCDWPDWADAKNVLAQLGYAGSIEPIDRDALLANPAEYTDALCLVRDTTTQDQLRGAGHWPGRVLLWGDVLDCQRVAQPLGRALAAAPRAEERAA